MSRRLDIREALRRLFKLIEYPYNVNPDVQGEVTLNLHGASFGDAFGQMLWQANADYRSEGGIIEIFRKENQVEGDVGSFHPPAIDVRGADQVSIFGEVFKRLGAKGIIYPEVRGTLSFTGEPSSVKDLLSILAAKANAVCRFTRQGYEILRGPPGGPLFKYIPNLPNSQPRILFDGNVKYVVQRDQLSKLARPSEKTLASIQLRPSIAASTLDLNRDSDRERLREYANLADCKLVIAPEVRSVVKIEAGQATVEHLTACLAKSLKLKVENGLILKPINHSMSMSLFDFRSIGEHTLPRSELHRVGSLLQVDSGRWRYFVHPSDLKIVRFERRPGA